MRANWTVNTIGCTNFLNELARRTGVAPRKVILFETAKVIEKCIALTPARQSEKIRTQVEFRNRTLWDNGDPENPAKRGSFVAGFGKKGEGWLFEESNWDGTGKRPRLIAGKSFHPMTEFHHWSDPRWARWQAALGKMREKAHNVREALRSRGVAKHYWYQMAKALGIEHLVKCPAYVKNAVSRNGRSYTHGTGREITTPAQFYVEIMNDSSLVVNRLNGASILQRAINGRRAYFTKNVEKAVFDDVKTIARRYRGIYVV